MQQPPAHLSDHLTGQPGPRRLDPVTRAGAGGIVLIGVLLGTVVAIYALGAVVDLLVDRGTLTCGESVGCGIGVGFFLVLTGVAGVLLGFVVALVLPFVLPGSWSTARALRCATVVAAGLVLLIALAMTVVWLSGAGGDPLRA